MHELPSPTFSISELGVHAAPGGARALGPAGLRALWRALLNAMTAPRRPARAGQRGQLEQAAQPAAREAGQRQW